MADGSGENPAHQAAERAARQAYGRILSILAARCGDIAVAEEALAEAFARALSNWPKSEPPDQPEAWLLTTARRYLADQARKSATARTHAGALLLLIEEGQSVMTETNDIPDDRLKLMLVCTHPEIDPALQTPLMLQTVLGLDAARIASAFLVKPATMGQRLSRLKARLRKSPIAFEIPAPGAWPQRLDAVLQGIYAAYNAGWDELSDTGLADEALFLARLASRLLPYETEAAGLLSLILHCEARRGARRDAAGTFVPLDEQDTALWDTDRIAEAETLLGTALRMGRPGRFQFEAALQSAHNARHITGTTDWAAIRAIYERLVAISPTLGALIGRAAAMAQTGDPQSALAALSALPENRIIAHQPYWATRAHVLKLAGDTDAAREAYGRAAGLTADPSVRAYLLARRAAL
ncbi:RNA polymerase sigma factor [Hyphobacterium sp.]|uniref:RNA polymerase sigma factor n=1 Tax=Hyphobacterium sp. TaxID=2004662 RepID=UPI003B5189E0